MHQTQLMNNIRLVKHAKNGPYFSLMKLLISMSQSRLKLGFRVSRLSRALPYDLAKISHLLIFGIELIITLMLLLLHYFHSHKKVKLLLIRPPCIHPNNDLYHLLDRQLQIVPQIKKDFLFLCLTILNHKICIV